MNAGMVNNIPPVLPGHLADAEETEDARREIISNLAAAQTSPDDSAAAGENLTTDDDLAPGGEGEREQAKAARRGKLKMIGGFVGGASFFVVLMFLILSYLFGFGFFAPAKRVTVNRSAGKNAATNNPAASDDEKLKTALTLAANSANGTADAPPAVSASNDPANALPGNQIQDPNQSVLGTKPDLLAKNNSLPSGNLVILPDEATQTGNSQTRGAVAPARPVAIESPANSNSSESNAANPLFRVAGVGNAATQTANERNASGAEKSAAVGRSIFFGRLPENKRDAPPKNSNRDSLITDSKNENAVKPPSFGTLLPVRLLGAAYTLRSSGGLVRMELTREVRGRGFTFPAGTVIVGTLRGSEYNRAFITAIGLIDQNSGGLIKFAGEMMGADGASGIKGERKHVKSFGSRFLKALREAGGQAVSVLASRRQSGGAVIIDTASLTGGEIGDEVSALLRGKSGGNSESFVKINAGAEGYVLVTDLPGEARLSDDVRRATAADSLANLSDGERILPGVGLSAAELADLFATSDTNRIRAALPRMTPQMRELAERALNETER
jgi:hypothetical protein